MRTVFYLFNNMHLQSPSPSLDFTVRRCQPELVAPAKPTPREVKLLSDIDDQEGLRFQIPLVLFYRYNPSMAGKDPVGIIKKAVAKTLVFYYPLAGRLREGGDRKLMVDCSGEGVLFVEADADVALDQFGDALYPPFPCIHELLYDVPGSSGIINSPLLLIQVTRLNCGGFILAIRLNHAISDGAGLVQFLKAVGEIANGGSKPSILPLWRRELLTARNPPRITRIHHEYDQLPFTHHAVYMSIPSTDILHRSFFFDTSQIAALRRLLPHHLARSSNFEVLAACLWRCRTMALQPLPEDLDVRLMFVVSIHSKLNSPLPVGYYGNGFVVPAAVTTAGKLCRNHFGYALELIKKAKTTVNEEYAQSVMDLMAMKGRPHLTTVRSFLMIDVTRAGFRDADVGWGKPVYGGPAKGGSTIIPEMTCHVISARNGAEVEGTVVPISLPANAMERFGREWDKTLNSHRGPLTAAPQIMCSI